MKVAGRLKQKGEPCSDMTEQATLGGRSTSITSTCVLPLFLFAALDIRNRIGLEGDTGSDKPCLDLKTCMKPL